MSSLKFSILRAQEKSGLDDIVIFNPESNLSQEVVTKAIELVQTNGLNKYIVNFSHTPDGLVMDYFNFFNQAILKKPVRIAYCDMLSRKPEVRVQDICFSSLDAAIDCLSYRIN